MTEAAGFGRGMDAAESGHGWCGGFCAERFSAEARRVTAYSLAHALRCGGGNFRRPSRRPARRPPPAGMGPAGRDARRRSRIAGELRGAGGCRGPAMEGGAAAAGGKTQSEEVRRRSPLEPVWHTNNEQSTQGPWMARSRRLCVAVVS